MGKGRPLKKQLDYFPLAVHMDENIRDIEREFGLLGFAIIIHLWQEIYGNEGYFIRWDRRASLRFADSCKTNERLVGEVIGRALEYGIFHKGMYEKQGILTSSGIQKRYLFATNRRKRDLKSDLLLISDTDFPLSQEENGFNADNNEDNDSEKYTNEKKENETKEKETEEKIVVPTFRQIEEFCEEKRLIFVNKVRFFEYYDNLCWQTKSGAAIDWRKKLLEWDAADKKKNQPDYPQHEYTEEDYNERIRKSLKHIEAVLNGEEEI